MSAASEARQSELDRVLDAQQVGAGLADELFAVAGLLGTQVSLRNALSDPTAPDQARRELATGVLGGKVSAGAVAVVTAAAGLRWASAGTLVGALERQGVRALLATAQAEGSLDTVEDELFRFGRIVAADPELRSVLDNRTIAAEGRGQVVTDLLDGKVKAATLALAVRAAGAVHRTLDDTVEDYLALAAEQRNRAVAHVTVARPLEQGQAERLRQALSRQVGRDVNLQVLVDPDVVGGVRVQLGDEVIDGTMSSRLQAAERELS